MFDTIETTFQLEVQRLQKFQFEVVIHFFSLSSCQSLLEICFEGQANLCDNYYMLSTPHKPQAMQFITVRVQQWAPNV